jgi:hypothetical protein
MTVKTGSGTFAGDPGFTEKRFLSDVPGYISGTPGAQVFAEKMATGRAAMQAMATAAAAASAAGGRKESPSETALNTANTNLAEEQGRIAQQQRSGYGSAGRDLLAQQQMDADISNKEATNKRMLDIAGMEAQGRIDAANITAKGKADVAGITTTGNAPEKENKQMQAERDDLYRQAINFGLDNSQLALIEKSLPQLYADSKAHNMPIPWSMIMRDVIDGKFKSR